MTMKGFKNRIFSPKSAKIISIKKDFRQWVPKNRPKTTFTNFGQLPPVI
jgi:hypothetical protein